MDVDHIDPRVSPSSMERRGVPSIGVPGRAACELSAGAPPCDPTVPDHVLVEYATADLEIRGASIRGLMHRYQHEPRQDAFSVVYDPESDTTLVVVCDGVGSLPRSHEAAAFVVERLPSLFWIHRDWEAAIKAVNDELQQKVDRLQNDPDSHQRGAHEMATTVVAAAISSTPEGRRAQIARSDDSTVWSLLPGGSWTMISADTSNEGAIHEGSVRALPAVSPRIRHTETVFESGALFVMTDGVDVPLAGSTQVRETLATWWSAPPTIFDFGSQVGFARKGHLDDRTVVGIWVRDCPA